MEARKIRVAITHGDTNSIGYELIFKTFSEPEMLDMCVPIVYGSPKVAAYHKKVMNTPAQFTIIHKAEDAMEGRLNLLAAIEDEVKVELGTATPESGTAAMKSLDRAMTDFRRGLFDVLVTTPVNKSNAQMAGYPFPGHTRFLETCVGEGAQAFNIYVNSKMRVASLTGMVPVNQVVESITEENVMAKVRLFADTLRSDFRVSSPRLAVLSLNPGINGEMGKEEREIILPAVEKLADEGIQVFGPYASDVFFGKGYYADFDGALGMYYEQVRTPFLVLSDGEGVIYTAGLPLIRTAADLEVRYDMAGKGKADEFGFRQALFMAIDIYRNKMMFKEPQENPLPKLYHEKKDESERVRFAIPKKHSNEPFPKKDPGQQE